MANQAAQNTPNDQQVMQAKQMFQALPRSCWVPTNPPDQKDAMMKLLDQLKARQDAEQKCSKNSETRKKRSGGYRVRLSPVHGVS